MDNPRISCGSASPCSLWLNFVQWNRDYGARRSHAAAAPRTEPASDGREPRQAACSCRERAAAGAADGAVRPGRRRRDQRVADATVPAAAAVAAPAARPHRAPTCSISTSACRVANCRAPTCCSTRATRAGQSAGAPARHSGAATSVPAAAGLPVPADGRPGAHAPRDVSPARPTTSAWRRGASGAARAAGPGPTAQGVTVTKTYVFRRGSYAVDVPTT